MLKIRRGDTILSVTNGAYNEIFKKQGFKPIEEGTESTQVTPPFKKVLDTPAEEPKNDAQEEYEEDEDMQEEYEEVTELTDKDLLETPISSIATMDIEDLRRLATLKGIDIDTYKTKKELRAQIKKVL